MTEDVLREWRMLRGLLEHFAYFDYSGLRLPAYGLLKRQAQERLDAIEAAEQRKRDAVKENRYVPTP